jgi:hypothetical protein
MLMVKQEEEAMKSEPLINVSSRVDEGDSLLEETGSVHRQLENEIMIAGKLQEQRLDTYVCCIEMMYCIFVYHYL